MRREILGNESGLSLLQIVMMSAVVALLSWAMADFMLDKDRANRKMIERTIYNQVGQQTSEEAGDPALIPNNMGLRRDQAYP